MSQRAYRSYQAVVLAGLGIYFLLKIYDGRVLLYINQRFVPLVLLAGVGLIFLAQLVGRERSASALAEGDAARDVSRASHPAEHEQHSGWVLWLVALPLLIGVLAPARPLSASALSSRGINYTTGLGSRVSSDSGEVLQVVQIPGGQRSVLDWLILFEETSDPFLLDGEDVDVTGFVYHAPGLSKDSFLVSRFTIACCVADAVALGMVVDWPEAAELPDNQWVRVRGTVYALEMDGKILPAVRAGQVEKVPAPEQPYLFP